MLRKTTLPLLILFCLCGGWLPQAAQTTGPRPGDLDPTFGTDGKVRTDFPLTAQVGGGALQPDGKIVVAARTGASNPYVIARYTSDGDPDTTFGTSNGRQISPFNVFTRAVAIQPDGKILVGGSGEAPLPVSFALFRLNSDGSTDASFGSNGLLTLDYGAESYAYDVVVLSDGKILVSGEVFLDNSFLLVRLNPNGSLDITFGNGGSVRAKMGTAVAPGAAAAIAIQPDGKIVAAGFSADAWAIARFHPDGQFDNDFSNDGKILFNFSEAADKAVDVVLQPDGKILVAGQHWGMLGATSVVARLNPDGTPDNTFGTGANGIVQPLQEINLAASLVLDASGKILIAGTKLLFPGNDIIVIRLNPDGSKDTTFGVGGVAQTDVDLQDVAEELLLQPDGKVVVVGFCAGSTTAAIVLARYLTAADPVLRVEAGSNHAVALDSVTFQRDPFSIVNNNFSTDHRTRIILFVANLTRDSGENSSAVTVQAEDSGGVHSLPVEYVGKVPAFDSLTQIVVKLPDGLAQGTALISVSLHGRTSNKGSIEIK